MIFPTNRDRHSKCITLIFNDNASVNFLLYFLSELFVIRAVFLELGEAFDAVPKSIILEDKYWVRGVGRKPSIFEENFKGFVEVVIKLFKL